MMIPGANASVPDSRLTVRIISGGPIDASAFRLFASGKVVGDDDMVFYGQLQNDDYTISLVHDNFQSSFSVDVTRLNFAVEKVAFAVTCDGNHTVANLQHLSIQVELNQTVLLKGQVELTGRTEAALILGELYRRQNQWKFRFIAQGFNGGLKPLAEYFGVDVADSPEEIAPVPPVPPTPINLSKISLTKEKPTISLTKQHDFGEIKVNLNWHRGGQKATKGLFGFLGEDTNVDLDLGAFVALNNSDRFVIQALGENFGEYYDEPYVQLEGDDRTGDIAEGEWLSVNGLKWNAIQEVLIYAFIYQGVASWDKTDGIVTIFVDGQPPIETKLTEGHERLGMCAIARLINESGAIKIERINRYFTDHEAMDKAFDWGFRWRAGRK